MLSLGRGHWKPCSSIQAQRIDDCREPMQLGRDGKEEKTQEKMYAKAQCCTYRKERGDRLIPTPEILPHLDDH